MWNQRLFSRNILCKIRMTTKYIIGDNGTEKYLQTSNQNNSIDIIMKNETECKEPDFVLDNIPHTSVREGKADVLFPASQDVFYNPVQEFNRDLSVAVLSLFASNHLSGTNVTNEKIHSKIKKIITSNNNIQSDISDNVEVNTDRPNNNGSENDNNTESNSSELVPGVKYENGIRIFEGLAASGLRSIRYAREVPGIKEIICNDRSKEAVECMETNISHNNVNHLVTASHNDASMVMYENRERQKRFHSIDLDPYGSPHLFLDGAVQAVADGGLLLITCTDTAILCGNNPETCYSKYGALSIKTKSCHEVALRIVLQSIESHANRYGRYILPLLSISADFYVRFFVKVFTSQKKVKESFSKLSWLYQCVGCETTTLQPLGNVEVKGTNVKYQLCSGPAVPQQCIHCNSRHTCAGPIWSAPIHDIAFVKDLKNSLNKEKFTTYKRMFGLLSMIEEELPDVPLHYVLSKLTSIIKVECCKMVMFRSALLNAGYRVSMSHTRKDSIKTDAPSQVIWDILRAWEKIKPTNKLNMINNTPGKIILEAPSKTDVSFEVHPESKPDSIKQALLRFQLNPERFWGPKRKAKTSINSNGQEEKRERNQGKKKKHSNEIVEQNKNNL